MGGPNRCTNHYRKMRVEFWTRGEAGKKEREQYSYHVLFLCDTNTLTWSISLPPFPYNDTCSDLDHLPCVWSKSLPSFSYNNQCNDLDHPQIRHGIWSKSPPSFSYNNQCIDLDHPQIRYLTWSKTPPSFSYNDTCVDLDHLHI